MKKPPEGLLWGPTASLLEALILLAALAVPAWAAPAAKVAVTDGWFRALPAGLPAGGYFTIRNGGPKDLAITGAKSPACGMLMLHQSNNEGGMSVMGMVMSVPVPAGKSVSFSPGGFHLMCMDGKLKVGGQAPVTLSLSDGSSVSASFAVKDAKGK